MTVKKLTNLDLFEGETEVVINIRTREQIRFFKTKNKYRHGSTDPDQPRCSNCGFIYIKDGKRRCAHMGDSAAVTNSKICDKFKEASNAKSDNK